VHREPTSELARRVDADFAALISAQPGFLSYEFLDGGGGDAMSISTFADAAQAEASRRLAARWTDDQLPDIELTVTESLHGEIAVSRIAPAAIDQRRDARVRRYRVTDAAEILGRVRDTFADRVAALDGFVSYRVVDCGGGELLSLSVFSDEAQAAASDELATRFVADELGDVGIERIDTVGGGRIVVSRFRSQIAAITD
jgi:hypothetical protein